MESNDFHFFLFTGERKRATVDFVPLEHLFSTVQQIVAVKMDILKAPSKVLFVSVPATGCVKSLLLADTSHKETLVQVKLLEVGVGCFGFGGFIYSKVDASILSEECDLMPFVVVVLSVCDDLMGTVIFVDRAKTSSISVRSLKKELSTVNFYAIKLLL